MAALLVFRSFGLRRPIILVLAAASGGESGGKSRNRSRSESGSARLASVMRATTVTHINRSLGACLWVCANHAQVLRACRSQPPTGWPTDPRKWRCDSRMLWLLLLLLLLLAHIRIWASKLSGQVEGGIQFEISQTKQRDFIILPV